MNTKNQQNIFAFVHLSTIPAHSVPYIVNYGVVTIKLWVARHSGSMLVNDARS